MDTLPASRVGKENEIRFDPEASKAAFEQAGWKIGPDGIREDKDGNKLVLTLLAKNESSYRRSAEVIQAQLAEAGVEAKITLMDPSSIRAHYKKESTSWLSGPMNGNADILEWF